MAKPARSAETIYDFGANNGDDIPYYLEKARKVVAVEANPLLAEDIRKRFAAEVKNQRLIVENVAVTEIDSAEPLPLYIHREHHVLSTILRPRPHEADKYDKVLVESISAPSLVQKHGTPLYIKIDLEGLDRAVLRALFNHDIFPHYISAEGHDPAIFGMLLGFGGYQRFKIVRGCEVGTKISDSQIKTAKGHHVRYRFPTQSAGPFGEDIEGPWLNAKQMFNVIRVEGLGWYDIHGELGPEPVDGPKPVRFSKSFRSFIKLTFPEGVVGRVKNTMRRLLN